MLNFLVFLVTLSQDCPPSGSAVLEGAVVRLRSGSARGPNGGPKGAGGGAAGAGSGRCWWELRAPGGALVCGLRVALLALRLPCDRGALRVADHLLCGGHLGTHSLRLPSPAASVPVHYSLVSSIPSIRKGDFFVFFILGFRLS